MKTIKEVLMRRDDMSESQALDLIEEAKEDLHERLEDGDLPLEICREWFGLEEDYLMDLI